MKARYAAAVAALVVVLTFNGTWSRTPVESTSRSRIGLVNLAYVFKYWPKCEGFNKDMQDVYKPFKERDEELEKQSDRLEKDLKGVDLPKARREELQKRLRQLRESIEENTRKAKGILAEKSGKQLQGLYAELRTATRNYAKAHHLEVVLTYVDAYTPEDDCNPALILRKLQTSPCLPLYAVPGTDISRGVLAELGYEPPADGKESPVPVIEKTP
jgi:Skp family chaperone for outer membrane proteins